MIRQRNKKETSCKPNVIPILDAVFIFIFFLLMSAQFLEIHEIGSDAPAVKTISEDNKDDRPPLNLTLKINSKDIAIVTGIEGVVKYRVPRNKENTFLMLTKHLATLKEKHPKETSVILRPSKGVDFKSIVRIMDASRSYTPSTESGRAVASKELFTQVIFETSTN